MPAIKTKSVNSAITATVTRKGVIRVGAQRDGITVTSVDDVPRDPSCCTFSYSVLLPVRSCSTMPRALLATVEYPLDGPARASFRTRDGKASSSSL